MFAIYHLYDVDSGFGDSVTQEELLGFVKTEDQAKEYVEKYSKLQIYKKPYDELTCHFLVYRPMEIKMLDITENPWENDHFTRNYELRDYVDDEEVEEDESDEDT